MEEVQTEVWRRKYCSIGPTRHFRYRVLLRWPGLYFLLRPQSEGNAIHLASRQDSKSLKINWHIMNLSQTLISREQRDQRTRSCRRRRTLMNKARGPGAKAGKYLKNAARQKRNQSRQTPPKPTQEERERLVFIGTCSVTTALVSTREGEGEAIEGQRERARARESDREGERDPATPRHRLRPCHTRHAPTLPRLPAHLAHSSPYWSHSLVSGDTRLRNPF